MREKFLRNCWYMAGWSADFGDELAPVTILEEPIVVYRKSDGTLAALEDRCCHRIIALSVGRKEGDEVRCMYHGLKFAADGRCTEIPGQDFISPKVCVRSYPIVEQHGAAWVWMGKPERADPALVPPISGPGDPDWAIVASQFEIDAHAELICDNLLDLSHAVFVHEKSFGVGDSNAIKSMRKGEEDLRQVTRLDRGVRVTRWHLNRTSNPFTGAQPSDDWVVQEFFAPGVFILRIRCYPLGVLDRWKPEEIGPDGPPEEPIFARCTCQIITSVDPKKSKFFYNFGPWAKNPVNNQQFFKTLEAALYEDKAIVEAQQSMIDRSPGHKMMMLNMDEPVVRYNNIYDKLLEADNA